LGGGVVWVVVVAGPENCVCVLDVCGTTTVID
jgi:hypothetical protein